MVEPGLLIPPTLTSSMNVKETPWAHVVFPVAGNGPVPVAMSLLWVCPLEREERACVFSVGGMLSGGFLLRNVDGWVWVFYRGWWSEMTGFYECLFFYF